jgi:DNA polymerase IV
MFRLIGIGLSSLCEADGADFADLIDRRSAGAEQAMDRLRERFGDEAVVKGLALEAEREE